MIRAKVVRQLMSYRLAADELKDLLVDLQSSGCKIINVFQTNIHEYEGTEGEGFTVIYDDNREVITNNKWISVKDRLPLLSHENCNNDFQVYKSSTRVLITLKCNPNYIFTGIYTDKGWMSDDRHKLDDVVAWMPLPTPYVETKEK